MLPFIRHRQWKRRCKWAEQLKAMKNDDETKQHEAIMKFSQQDSVMEHHIAGESSLTIGKQASPEANANAIPEVKARGKNSSKACDINSTVEQGDEMKTDRTFINSTVDQGDEIKTDRTFEIVKNCDDSNVKDTCGIINTDKEISTLHSAEEDGRRKVVKNPAHMHMTVNNKRGEHEEKLTAHLNNFTNTNEQNRECRSSKSSGTTVTCGNSGTKEISTEDCGQSTVDKNEGRMLLVLPDSDSDYEGYLENACPRLEEEQFAVQETLHLTLEEAFFLSFGLGCLQVIDLFGNCLSLDGIWQLFCKSQKDFIQKYVTYHYFRSKGWVVKPGIKFGGDFCKFNFYMNFSKMVLLNIVCVCMFTFVKCVMISIPIIPLLPCHAIYIRQDINGIYQPL